MSPSQEGVGAGSLVFASRPTDLAGVTRLVGGYTCAVRGRVDDRRMMGPQHARRALGVPSEATPREVDRAFRRLARQLHPDHGGDVACFRELVHARAVLQDATGGGSRPPLVVVHRKTWWRRLISALADLVGRQPPPPPRVR